MKLSDAQALAEAAIEQWLDDSWTFRWMNGRRTFGRCRYNIAGTIHEIHLSKILTEMNDVDAVLDVILHEVAHALTKGHGHDAVWKSTCRRVGANPERCYDGDEVETPPARYVGACGSGCTIERDRLIARFKRGVTCKKHHDPVVWVDQRSGRSVSW